MSLKMLTKSDLILKFSPYGVKTIPAINRLIREQGLPAKRFSAHKVFFEEEEINNWLGNGSLAVPVKRITTKRKRAKGKVVKEVAELREQLKAVKKAEAIRKAEARKAETIRKLEEKIAEAVSKVEQAKLAEAEQGD
jgi:hypothetical protein